MRPGSGSRPDELIVHKAGIEDGEQALEEALAFKGGLMRAGLVAYNSPAWGSATC